MKAKLLSALLGFIYASGLFAQSLTLNFTIYPMGSFSAITKEVRGKVSRKKGKWSFGKTYKVDVRSLQTGNDLRDQHLKKKLKADKHRWAILKVKKISMKKKRGSGTLTIGGKSKKLVFRLSREGKHMVAKFVVNIGHYVKDEISYLGVSVEDEVVGRIEIPISE